jgi:hypothetical protein
LESLDITINKGEYWIQIHLNIFEFNKILQSIHNLNEIDSLPFLMTINNNEKYMRLRCDDYKGPPIFYMMFLPKYKISRYYTEKGYKNELQKLKSLIKKDTENIDMFVKRWHEIYKPNLVDWEGNIIKYS